MLFYWQVIQNKGSKAPSKANFHRTNSGFKALRQKEGRDRVTPLAWRINKQQSTQENVEVAKKTTAKEKKKWSQTLLHNVFFFFCRGWFKL